MPSQYVIARGHSKQKTSLAEQNKKLALKIISAPEFRGADFSWGDSQIVTCAVPGSKNMGWPTGWVAIDSNHHMQTIVLEVLEHQRQVIHGHTAVQNYDNLV